MSSLRVGVTSALCAALAAWTASACGRLGYDAGAAGDDDSSTVPDATPGTSPDATPGSGPDAAPGTPDAAPGATGDELPLTSGAADSQHPVVAFTGDGFDVVWDDTRDGNNEIYLQRIENGALAGSNQRLTQANGYSGFPSVAWNGSFLAVAWEDGRLGSDEVFFTRFDKAGGAGTVQNPLSNALGTAYDPSLIWNGSTFAASWEDGGGTASELYFTHVSMPTNVAAFTPLRRTNSSGRSLLSSLAWDGNNFGLAWEDDRDGKLGVYFTRVTAAGDALGSEERINGTAGRGFSPSLAWNGQVYGVAYEDDRTGVFKIYFRAVLPGGVPTGIDVPVSTGSIDANEACVVWASDRWAITYLFSGQVHLVELDGATLQPLAAPRIIGSMSGHADNPRLVWATNTYGVVWQDNRSGNWDVYFREVAQ